MAAADEHRPRAVARLVIGNRTYPLHDVDDPARCNLGLAEDLLRLQVQAKRLGWRVRISEVREELRELFDLMGLTGQLDDD